MREKARAVVYGPRWRLLSDMGGLAVALMIAAKRGQGTIGWVASQLEACGVASRSRVLGLARTLAHLGGLASRPCPEDRRARLLSPSGWLPAFLDDWLRGHLTALRKCGVAVLDERRARAILDRIVIEQPAALFGLGRLDWITHAVGGGLWLLALFDVAHRRADGTIVSRPSLKALSKVSGISRAHYAYLRSLGEGRGLLARSAKGSSLLLAKAFYRRGRGLIVRRLAIFGATMVWSP